MTVNPTITSSMKDLLYASHRDGEEQMRLKIDTLLAEVLTGFQEYSRDHQVVRHTIAVLRKAIKEV